MAMANIAVRQEHHALELHHTQTPAIKSIVGFLKLALEGRAWSGITFRVYDVLYALDSLCKCHERDLIGIECGLVDVAVQVTAQWRPGQFASIFSDAKASTHPVLELSSDILMHLAHSEACRQRMLDLHLEPTLDRLMLQESGIVRDHVLKVLYVIRDRKTMEESAKQIVAHVKVLQAVSDSYEWNQKNHKELALRLNAVMHQADVSEDMRAAWTWLRDALRYDQMDKVLALMRGTDRKTFRRYFDAWHTLKHPHPTSPSTDAPDLSVVAELGFVHDRSPENIGTGPLFGKGATKPSNAARRVKLGAAPGIVLPSPLHIPDLRQR